ncbi:hypothetical protein POSPLADRAFT_1054981 [Postia placenta MAD-698-R-SB12]|uniref:Uncharacterized protein n=1 Tax=Postia placenta MAD-698-R-SB12 TaxID=670580 RepID=A0A1X6N7B3_9APHY|nr:hypothetical protein POSPLADRAFT_1054981 [Postia placenta MAD-698-R-SB12]OSX64366.1 hypothetical protein POSPLADRAFT_1054981 [Postia placenta MAD-698-R-SB12]
MSAQARSLELQSIRRPGSVPRDPNSTVYSREVTDAPDSGASSYDHAEDATRPRIEKVKSDHRYLLFSDLESSAWSSDDWFTEDFLNKRGTR